MPLSRDIHEARRAYQAGDVAASVAAHSATAAEHHQQGQGQYIKSAVFGGLDGTITTFAVVAGVAGAALTPGVVLVLGFANLVADGLSMAIGDYLSTKAEQEYQRAERRREQWEVEHFPDGEKQELVELYTGKGISEADARTVVDVIARYPQAWVDVMMVEELGILASRESPLASALVTFFSFAFFGFIPVLAYVLVRLVPGLAGVNTFALASLFTAATLFGLGALKVKVTGKHWLKSGLETLVIGSITAAAAYAVGAALGSLAG